MQSSQRKKSPMDYFNTKLYQIHKHKRKITKTLWVTLQLLWLNTITKWDCGKKVYFCLCSQRETIMVGGAIEVGIQSKKLTDQIFSHKHQVERENWMGCSAMNSWSPTQWVLSPAAPQCLPKELHQPETKYSNIGGDRRQIFIQSITNTSHSTSLYRRGRSNCQTICETMETWMSWPNKFESLGLLPNISALEKTAGINPSRPCGKIES